MAKREPTLKQKIFERQKFLNRVAEFSGRIVWAHGKTDINEERDEQLHHWKAHLEEFQGLGFYVEVRSKTFSSLEIYWLESVSEGKMVLQITWRTVDDFQIHRFDPDPAWQEALKKLMRRTSILKNLIPVKPHDENALKKYIERRAFEALAKKLWVS